MLQVRLEATRPYSGTVAHTSKKKENTPKKYINIHKKLSLDNDRNVPEGTPHRHAALVHPTGICDGVVRSTRGAVETVRLHAAVFLPLG